MDVQATPGDRTRKRKNEGTRVCERHGTMEELLERERSGRAREGHVDEKGGHGGAVPAAFGESTVWRSVLLGARATVSAKAAAGNLLVRPRIVPPFFFIFLAFAVHPFLAVFH